MTTDAFRRARRALAATTMTGAGLLGIGAAASPAGAADLAAANTTVRAASGNGVAVAATPTAGGGYLTAWTDGTVVTSGAAPWDGDLRGQAMAARVVGIAATPSGKGYWLVGADGGVFAFGDAGYFGSTGGMALTAPIVGIEPTPDGGGYWLVASDGGVFAFGDASYHGSLGATPPAQPIVGITGTGDGRGYWLVASDGGVFAFGDAPFLGSASGTSAGDDTVAVAREGGGYWLLGGSGDVEAYGATAPPGTGVALAATSPMGVPAASLPPSAAFTAHCSTGPSAACDPFALSEIDGARSLEGLGPLALPSGYADLAPGTQLVVVTDAERTSRGLPSMSEDSGLDAESVAAAAADTDPSGPAGTTWASVLSTGYTSALAADYQWMYDDGVGGINVDCTAAGAPGCWGHRAAILSPWAGSMGAGAVGADLTALFVAS